MRVRVRAGGKEQAQGARSATHPRVLMKPLTEPSAYRDTISPICRKLEAESDMLQLLRPLRRCREAEAEAQAEAQVETVQTFPGAPSQTSSRAAVGLCMSEAT